MPAQARPDPAGDRLVRIVGGGRSDVYGLEGNTSGDGKTVRRESDKRRYMAVMGGYTVMPPTSGVGGRNGGVGKQGRCAGIPIRGRGSLRRGTARSLYRFRMNAEGLLRRGVRRPELKP
jgi:hypothetical protein